MLQCGPPNTTGVCALQSPLPSDISNIAGALHPKFNLQSLDRLGVSDTRARMHARVETGVRTQDRRARARTPALRRARGCGADRRPLLLSTRCARVALYSNRARRLRASLACAAGSELDRACA